MSFKRLTDCKCIGGGVIVVVVVVVVASLWEELIT
jgi:hypothetical protein